MMKLLILFGVCCLGVLAFGKKASVKNAFSKMFDDIHKKRPKETHHSLHHPFSSSMVYWNFGGSTVFSNEAVRLTPDTQDRRGWLWNEYPLESNDWEVEFQFDVYSKPNYGGDGMCMWIMSGDLDPAFHDDVKYLEGKIFGMRTAFDGYGICMDVYDNDNKRNNPSVFVIENNGNEEWDDDHDKDFDKAMVKRQVDESAYKCVVDVRNTGRKIKAMARVTNKVLHVYFDTADGNGYKFCLSVRMETNSNAKHIAFSAATGGVADTYEILEITTRYLTPADDLDDSSLSHLGDHIYKSGYTAFMTLLNLMLALAMLGLSTLQFQTSRGSDNVKMDEVKITNQLNKTVTIHFQLHWAFTVLTLFSSSSGWVSWSLHCLIAAFRGYSFAVNSYRFTVKGGRAGMKNSYGVADLLPTNYRIYSNLALYGFTVVLLASRF